MAPESGGYGHSGRAVVTKRATPVRRPGATPSPGQDRGVGWVAVTLPRERHHRAFNLGEKLLIIGRNEILATAIDQPDLNCETIGIMAKANWADLSDQKLCNLIAFWDE